MDLKEKIKALPKAPGVYLMKDSLNTIIYVGKSKNLKSRVGSYFQNSNSYSPKVVNLINNLKDFEYIQTDTEFEAFMLECKLIKEFKPHYNKKMKSPKSYTYIIINMIEKYPNLEISNNPCKNNEGLCWGPYTGKNVVEVGVEGIRECLKILCKNTSKKASTCLNYSLGLCIGLCLEEPNNNKVVDIFNRIIALLNGKDKSILDEMTSKMNAAAEKFDYESAAKYRNYINAIDYILCKAKVIEFTEMSQYIVLVEYLNENLAKLFLIKGNRVIFSEKCPAEDLTPKNINCIKNKILITLKADNYSLPISIGNDEIDESQIIYSYINSNTASCKHTILEQDWIKNENYTAIDEALHKLLITKR
jgi:excinuclease ABC subunit C